MTTTLEPRHDDRARREREADRLAAKARHFEAVANARSRVQIMSPDALITMREFAAMLRVTPKTLRERERRGEPMPPRVVLGPKTIRYRLWQAEQVVQQMSANSNSEGAQ